MADESNSRSSKGRKIEVNLPELDGIILSTQPNLSKEDYDKLRAAYNVLQELLTPPFRNDESADAVLGNVPVPDEPAEEKPKKPGHGRAKPEKFTQSKKVAVPHPSLKPGMPCPCGCGGRSTW